MTSATNKTHKTESTILIRRRMTQSAFVMLCLFLIGFNATAQEGQIIRETFHSPSLEGNLFGDSPDRPVVIYLPPSYDTELGRSYPVVYLLHGYQGDHNKWAGGNFGNILDSMKTWLEQGKVKEMIFVMPNSNNKFGGSSYTNSSATGNWADYIAKDLVEYIDNHYRTWPHPRRRGVIGHSMGGYGALKLGTLYPEIFGYMGGLAGGYMIEALELNEAIAIDYAHASTVENWNQFSSLISRPRWSIGFAAAFAPNPDRWPFYCDFPFVYTDTTPREVIKVQEVYDKFLEHDTLRLTETHRDVLLRMRAIYIDCGTRDILIEHSRQLHEKLEGLGIEHFYNEFLGGHGSKAMARTGDALEAFSDAMVTRTADFNADGIVDAADMSIMVDYWGTDNPLCDIGPMPWGDGVVDVQDLIVLAEHLFEAVYDPTLVAHWALDEAEGMFAAETVNGNDGIVLGNPVWQPEDGRVQGALRFDGIDDMLVTKFVLDLGESPFSIFAWIHGGAPGQAVISQQTGVNWLQVDADGTLMTQLTKSGARRAGVPLYSEAVITDGNWHRVGFVWDGSQRTLYVDGSPVATDSQSGLEGSTGGLVIGAGQGDQTGAFWSGMIDEVRIYNRAVKP